MTSVIQVEITWYKQNSRIRYFRGQQKYNTANKLYNYIILNEYFLNYSTSGEHMELFVCTYESTVTHDSSVDQLFNE